MNTSLSFILKGYYDRERETLATEPAVRAELLQLGVASVHADYDGVGDSGQIERLSYSDAANPPQDLSVSESLNGRVEALFYAVIELRHSGWENNDGAFGTFRWDLREGSFQHEHHQRFSDHETFLYEGFDADTGGGL